ncbi:MAG: response regulator [Dialister sp.]|nr:response regulator [Dialister sp.]
MASTPDTQQSLLREARMEMIFSQLLLLDQISDRATYDTLIPSLLENIGQITHANRAYIFSIHEEEECYYRNTYEWCQDGVTPQIENLQHVPAALIPYWDDMLRRGKAISIWDLETVRDTMPAEYDILHAQNIRSIAVLPIFAAGKFVGFIGLDDPDHSVYDIASKILQVISGHLGCIRSHLDAQKTLRESRARLESQLISLERETYLVDVLASDYRLILHCNLTQDTFETIKGVPRCPTDTSGVFSEWVRKAYDEYVVHASAPDFLSFFDRKQLLAALSTKQILSYRLEVIPDEAGHRHLEIQITPLHSVKDDQHKIAIGIRSIDDLVLREKCLQAEKEKARKRLQFRKDLIATIGKIYCAIYFLDLDKGTYMEITGKSAYQNTLGNEGLLNKGNRIVRRFLVAPESQASMKDFLDPSTLSDRLRERDTLCQSYLTTDGIWHLGRFIVKSRHEDGSASTLLYTIQNIDEAKRTEIAYQEELKKSAREAQIASQAKTDFLRRMSHDIRTPINGILGMVEIADSHPADIEKLRDCRHKIHEAANMLLAMVNDILDMNKLESGRLEPESVPFDILELLTEVNHLAGIQAPAYGVTTHVKNPPFPVRRVIGSPTFLRRVLLNLAGNALKYNRRGGRIDFSCDKIEIKGDTAYFTLTCADTGIGMSEDFQKRAFEPFTQESNTARTRYMGTGLGLAIVKELVEKMDGTIALESQEGVGSRFSLTVPFTIDHAPQEEEKAAKSPVSLAGLHVLLAEDNELNREIAVFLLEKEGMEITACENGAEAVKAFRESPQGYYDLILMDIMMPVMDGYEASRQIRSLPRLDAAVIPIFAMTANAFQDDIEKSHKNGMNEHLTKPLHTEVVLATIRKYVG